MNIQILKQRDIHTIAALQPAGWQDITPVIDAYTKTSFCFPVKALLNDKIVGIGTGIVHHEVAWLAHIIVHTDYRNKGIGKAITESLIEAMHHQHCETIYLIATDMGEPVYKKVGFETETEYLCYKDVKLFQNTNPENVISYSEKYKDEIASLDKKISGEKRMFHLEPYLTNAYVYLHNKHVEGYYLPGLGEGMINAITGEAGTELMKFRFTTKDIISFPIENNAASSFMSTHNFSPFKIVKRMRLGKERIWQAADIYGRIGGNLG